MTHLLPSLALVVEDDQFQREILSDFLKNENIDVIQCESAEAAELVIARAGAEISLLVTDVRLADQGNGIALAEFAHEKYPQMSIVVVSGADGLNVPAYIRFVRKPYDLSDLLLIARCVSWIPNWNDEFDRINTSIRAKVRAPANPGMSHRFSGIGDIGVKDEQSSITISGGFNIFPMIVCIRRCRTAPHEKWSK